MSDKAECPGCNAYTSGVLADDVEGVACRYCGLSAGARAEIRQIRQSRADQAARERIEQLVKELDEAHRELRRLRAFRSSIQQTVERALRDDEG